MADLLKATLGPTSGHPDQPALIEPLGWLVAASTTFLVAIASTDTGAGSAIFALGILMSLLGVRVFLKHGGRRITALGLFALSSSIVVGVGAIQEVISPQHRTAEIYLEVAVYFSFVAQCLVYYIAWKPCSSTQVRGHLLDSRRADSLKWVSCTALAALTAVRTLADAQSQVVEASAFAIIVLIAIGALAVENRPIRLLDLLILASGIVLYAQIYQGGSGRLRLVALAFTIAIIWATTHPTRSFKWCLLAAAPLAMVALAHQRLGLQESLRAGASYGRTGLESMTEPILVFAQVIQAQAEHGWPLAGGRTFFTLPASLLPVNANLGTFEPLGYELVRITQPASYGTGYSVAATTFGEWWYNFSAYSLVLVVPFLILVLSILDRGFTRSINRLATRGGALRFTIIAMACGSIADLAWMGLHIYGARMLWRIPATVVVLLCVAVLTGGRRDSRAGKTGVSTRPVPTESSLQPDVLPPRLSAVSSPPVE